MKLYLKVWNPNGQVLGIKGLKGEVRQVARLYSDRGVEVKDADAKILMERYPNHAGDYEKDQGKVEARAKKMKSQMSGERHGRLRKEGPARQPKEVRHHVVERQEDEAVDEEIPENWDASDDALPETEEPVEEIQDSAEGAPDFQEKPKEKPKKKRSWKKSKK